jgi:hypothetical protein
MPAEQTPAPPPTTVVPVEATPTPAPVAPTPPTATPTPRTLDSSGLDPHPEPDPEPAPQPDPDPEPPRRANVGAGFGLTNGSVVSGQAAALALPVRLSIEKSITSSTWLMLNGAALHSSFDVQVLNLVDPTKDRVLRLTESTVIGTVGVRQLLLPGLVDFSAYLGVQVGNTWINGDALLPVELSAGPEAGTSALLVGAVAGVTVERELVKSLALRIGVQALSLTWIRTGTTDMIDGVAKETVLKTTSYGLSLEPSIELRLYF